MKFGCRVAVTRGGSSLPLGVPGCKREVPGIYVFARGHACWVRLLEGDPLDTVGWNRAGMTGQWSRSAVRLAG